MQVTVAQQYVDDLYKLEVLNEDNTEDLAEEDLAEDMPVLQQSSSGLPFYSSIDVSLGIGEVSQFLK